ncbi:helix-turn-helix domain-containing protein [Sporosarcina ureae]|uniref:helix-turn-helix domain-containing protein n=1 Tax=Sporosarcina ureae TaxID=1571 RepID=UPI000A17A817|nr:helix-turn-helix domain-containing protein [Sporosarcina ureae]ARK21369.1 excisionase [Sporosarcina ureae]
MLNIEVNEETVKAMLEQAIQERVEELAKQRYFMTYAELAEYLNISKPVIEDRLIKNGLKFYKVGTKYLFKQNEVDEFLDDMTASMTATNNDIKFFNRLNAERGDPQ